jgi:hypothetical protein
MNPKILFVLKRREDYNSVQHNKIGLTTGLYNSATFVKDMLLDLDLEAELVVVIDNNDIDREVTKYKPTHVIIEAIWVEPSKFHVLQKLHPDVIWIIRNHSEMPFIANEGMAMRWFGDYSTYKNVIQAPNAPRMLKEMRQYLMLKNNWDLTTTKEKIIYLPNFFPQKYTQYKKINYNKEFINVGCFGAIRPLKNHLLQAFASIDFAESIDKKVNFHINVGRIEMKGDPVLHNLKGLFEHIYEKGHQLITHQWSDRDTFLNTCYQMDIGLQVSFSETFNIVAADFISQGVPVVASTEIPWSCSYFNADPVDSDSIKKAINKTYHNPRLNVISNRYFLHNYTNKTKMIWYNFFKRGIYV